MMLKTIVFLGIIFGMEKYNTPISNYCTTINKVKQELQQYFSKSTAINSQQESLGYIKRNMEQLKEENSHLLQYYCH